MIVNNKKITFWKGGKEGKQCGKAFPPVKVLSKNYIHDLADFQVHKIPGKSSHGLEEKAQMLFFSLSTELLSSLDPSWGSRPAGSPSLCLKPDVIEEKWYNIGVWCFIVLPCSDKHWYRTSCFTHQKRLASSMQRSQPTGSVEFSVISWIVWLLQKPLYYISGLDLGSWG